MRKIRRYTRRLDKCRQDIAYEQGKTAGGDDQPKTPSPQHRTADDIVFSAGRSSDGPLPAPGSAPRYVDDSGDESEGQIPVEIKNNSKDKDKGSATPKVSAITRDEDFEGDHVEGSDPEVVDPDLEWDLKLLKNDLYVRQTKKRQPKEKPEDKVGEPIPIDDIVGTETVTNRSDTIKQHIWNEVFVENIDFSKRRLWIRALVVMDRHLRSLNLVERLRTIVNQLEEGAALDVEGEVNANVVDRLANMSAKLASRTEQGLRLCILCYRAQQENMERLPPKLAASKRLTYLATEFGEAEAKKTGIVLEKDVKALRKKWSRYLSWGSMMVSLVNGFGGNLAIVVIVPWEVLAREGQRGDITAIVKYASEFIFQNVNADFLSAFLQDLSDTVSEALGCPLTEVGLAPPMGQPLEPWRKKFLTALEKFKTKLNVSVDNGETVTLTAHFGNGSHYHDFFVKEAFLKMLRDDQPLYDECTIVIPLTAIKNMGGCPFIIVEPRICQDASSWTDKERGTWWENYVGTEYLLTHWLCVLKAVDAVEESALGSEDEARSVSIPMPNNDHMILAHVTLDLISKVANICMLDSSLKHMRQFYLYAVPSTPRPVETQASVSYGKGQASLSSGWFLYPKGALNTMPPQVHVYMSHGPLGFGVSGYRED